jgi:putative membrane protein
VAHSEGDRREESAMMYGYGMGGWGYLFMIISSVLFWGLLIIGIVVLVRHFGGSRSTGTTAARPEQILAERYARGEIDDEDYQRRLDTLRRGGHALIQP